MHKPSSAYPLLQRLLGNVRFNVGTVTRSPAVISCFVRKHQVVCGDCVKLEELAG